MSSVADLLDYLTDDERVELDLLLSLPEALSLREFATIVNPKYRWYRHCEVLADALERVANDEIGRLMVYEPPRHGKSELASRIFPAYYLYRHSDRWVGLNSYAADLAQTFSRTARDHFTHPSVGGHTRDDSASVKHWETPEGGGMWAAGVGGPITGKGFHLGIIDDPIKNAEEAGSEVIREKQKDWYRSTFYTRAEPDAAIVIIQTRWHEDDLAGWLLSLEHDEEPERWHIVNLPAIAEPADERPVFPVTCTVEPDWRKPGEALCPERYDATRLRQLRTKVGSYYFGAMYQQRPTSAEGGLFKRKWWQYHASVEALQDGVVLGDASPTPSSFDLMFQSWDMNFKDKDDSDFVVGQVWGVKGPNAYLLDQVRDRMDMPTTLVAVRGMSAKWPRAVAKYVEDKANGSAVVQTLRVKTPGFIPVEPKGSKEARAAAASPYVEAGNVFLPAPELATWVHDFVNECAAFPVGTNDDQVDALSQALAKVGGMMRAAAERPVAETKQEDRATPYDYTHKRLAPKPDARRDLLHEPERRTPGYRMPRMGR